MLRIQAGELPLAASASVHCTGLTTHLISANHNPSQSACDYGVPEADAKYRNK